MCAGVVTFGTLPWLRNLSVSVGLVDDPGHRKIHGEPIPLAGGIAVLLGILAPLAGAVLVLMFDAAAGTGGLLGERAESLLRYGMSKRALELGAILLGAVGMTAVGLLDDKFELKPRTKFAGQVLVALLVAASGARVTLFIPNVLFSYVVTVFWILAVINAFNFMDNMDGLCAGLGAIAATWFGLLAAVQGQYLVGLLAFLTAGALTGFLPHNFPRARCFLGDSGSHLVGYLLAVIAILPHFHTPTNPRPWAVLTPLFVLAVPLVDMAWVVLIRWRIGQAFYQGDTNHVSHRLVRRGLSRTKAVVLIWLAAAVIPAVSLLF
jgi:UDP-GlcNAc:undecaprenyl-phosphate GlcNAc-1-phosphate transferase